MFSYKVTQNSGDSHQQSAYWLLVFVRFKYRDTFNHDPIFTGSDRPLQNNPAKAVEELPDLLVVDDDCISWQTSSSKQSHVSSANVQLCLTDTDYVKEIAPEDWMMLWAFNNFSDYARVKALVTQKKRANRFMDGLKFMGRVQSVFNVLARNPNNGTIQVNFEVQAAGFSEFDSTIYYNEAIARKYNNLLSWMSDFGSAANDFVVAGSIDANDAIPKLMRICLGLGPGPATSNLATTNLQSSPNDSYIIPTTVAKLILSQLEQQQKPVGFTYADLFKHWIGVQKYSGNVVISPDGEDEADFTSNSSLWRGFVPDFTSNSQKTYISPTKLTGEFAPLPLHFNKVSVWSLLGTYLNEPINEMYTCLRVDETGHIVPTLITRQIPFSSKPFLNSGEVGTSYLDLPRWEIDESLIQQMRVGRSNATRFNYVHITGMSPIDGNLAGNQVINFVNAPPITDDADIRRAGLRMFQTQVGAKVIKTDATNQNNPSRKWSKLMADMLFGSHLKFSGVVTLKGIQEPICEGDNCVVDEVIYHIERVQHSGFIDVNGNRDFNTTLQVSNGISTQSDKKVLTVYPDLTGSTTTVAPVTLNDFLLRKKK